MALGTDWAFPAGEQLHSEPSLAPEDELVNSAME
jgi:hypothetical protein